MRLTANQIAVIAFSETNITIAVLLCRQRLRATGPWHGICDLPARDVWRWVEGGFVVMCLVVVVCREMRTCVRVYVCVCAWMCVKLEIIFQSTITLTHSLTHSHGVCQLHRHLPARRSGHL